MQNVEDIFPLSAMQEMMLMHSVSTRSDNVLFNQFCYRIDGTLDVKAFIQSWQRLIQRHAVFRTAFLYDNLPQPLQVIRKTVEFPFVFIDWREMSTEEQKLKFHKFCIQDSDKGFDIRKAPLTRATLMQCSKNSYLLLWSSHHLIIDRWCLGTFFDELFAFYQTELDGKDLQLPLPGSYRSYIQWIQRQKATDAELYWRNHLAGFTQASSLTRAIRKDESSLPDSAKLSLSAEKANSMQIAARKFGVTSNNLIQAAWSLLLNRHTGSTDVVFGNAVSGRPVDLESVESIIGVFINNMPVRGTLSDSAFINVWLKEMQIHQQKSSRFEYISLLDIQSWSPLPDNESLFDTLLVWLASEPLKLPKDLKLTGLPGDLKTTYPLTVSVSVTKDSVVLEAILQSGYVTPVSLSQLLNDFESILDSLIETEKMARLGEIVGFRPGTPLKNEDRSDICTQVNTSSSKNIDSKKGLASGREDADEITLQDLLLALWQRLLPVDEIQIDDNFFDLGGTSLLAVRLHAAIQSNTHKSIPLLALFRQPTLGQMAETMKNEDWPLLTQTVYPIRTTGRRLPLFCIASPEVNTVGYTLLSRHLGSDQPVYVVQQPPDSENIRRLKPEELLQIAETYIHEMSKIQPTGPYQLLGMCTGAQLSLEMARLLEARGESVSFLGLINTWGYYTVSPVYYLTRIANRAGYYRERIITLFTEQPNDVITVLSQTMKQRLNGVLALITRVEAHPGTATDLVNADAGSKIAAQPEEYDNDDPWIDKFGWYWRDPKAEKYPATAVVFRIKKQQYWRVPNRVLGWGKQIKQVTSINLPGDDHDSILREPNVQVMAEKLRNILSRHQTN